MLAVEVRCQGIHSLGAVVVVENYGAAYGDCAVRSRMVYPHTTVILVVLTTEAREDKLHLDERPQGCQTTPRMQRCVTYASALPLHIPSTSSSPPLSQSQQDGLYRFQQEAQAIAQDAHRGEVRSTCL